MLTNQLYSNELIKIIIFKYFNHNHPQHFYNKINDIKTIFNDIF